MSLKEKYTCPRCGFVFSVILKSDEWQRTIKCEKCQKTMNICNKFQVSPAVKTKKKAHYLHKALLN